VESGGWTNFYTRRIGAMVTSMDGKFPGGMGKLTLFYIFHMGTVYANRNIVLAFASNGAGMTANAHSIIYDKSVIHLVRVSRNFGQGNINENFI
jgi:hypothetical protein